MGGGGGLVGEAGVSEFFYYESKFKIGWGWWWVGWGGCWGGGAGARGSDFFPRIQILKFFSWGGGGGGRRGMGGVVG